MEDLLSGIEKSATLLMSFSSLAIGRPGGSY